jgi:hypothetical protein
MYADTNGNDHVRCGWGYVVGEWCHAKLQGIPQIIGVTIIVGNQE